MRVALIPPVSHLDFTYQTDMQLMLPELLGEPEYRRVMDDHLSNPNQYVILDNGAAEAKQPDDQELVAIVEDLYPQEFALPDVLSDGPETARRALDFISKYGDVFADGPTKLGLVTQGRSLFDAARTAYSVLQEEEAAELISVLYIPRLLLKTGGTSRVQLANHFFLNYPYKEVHFFGASATYPDEVYQVARIPWIRSIDTSLPFSSAVADASLRLSRAESRNEHYFQSVFDSEQLEVAKDNVQCYLEWAGLR